MGSEFDTSAIVGRKPQRRSMLIFAAALLLCVTAWTQNHSVIAAVAAAKVSVRKAGSDLRLLQLIAREVSKPRATPSASRVNR